MSYKIKSDILELLSSRSKNTELILPLFNDDERNVIIQFEESVLNTLCGRYIVNAIPNIKEKDKKEDKEDSETNEDDNIKPDIRPVTNKVDIRDKVEDISEPDEEDDDDYLDKDSDKDVEKNIENEEELDDEDNEDIPKKISAFDKYANTFKSRFK